MKIREMSGAAARASGMGGVYASGTTLGPFAHADETIYR